jgi:hypothetical protein
VCVCGGVCVCVGVWVCVRGVVRVGECVCVRACVRVCVRVCVTRTQKLNMQIYAAQLKNNKQTSAKR